jgi:hypothetical protein
MLKEASLDKCRYPLCNILINGKYLELAHNDERLYVKVHKNKKADSQVTTTKTFTLENIVPAMELEFATVKEIDSAIMTFVYPML